MKINQKNSNNTKEATFTAYMVFASNQRIIQGEKDESSDNKNQMKQRVFFTFLNSRETDHSLCFPGECGK